jgi:TRAP-type C4-dicarboxylate transport system substrate-binding protein
MKNNKSIVKLFICIIIGLSLFLAPSVSCAKVYKWRMQAFIPKSVMFFPGYIDPFVKLINERTNGQIQITSYPVGSIIGPMQMSEGVAEGVLDCALHTTGYDAGRMPEAYVPTNLPFSFETVEQGREFWKREGESFKIVEEAYSRKGIKLINIIQSTGSMVYYTMFPVKGYDDFKGKKIRSSGQWASVVSNIGASQVNLSLGEVYQALEKGVIDGLLMMYSGLSDFKWNEVVKQVVMPPIQQNGSACVIVNKDSFNSLPANLQKIFIDTALEVEMNYLHDYTLNYHEKVTKEANEKGVKFVTMSDSDIAKFKKSTLGMWQKVEKMNANTAKQIDLLRKYLDSKGVEYPK